MEKTSLGQMDNDEVLMVLLMLAKWKARSKKRPPPPHTHEYIDWRPPNPLIQSNTRRKLGLSRRRGRSCPTSRTGTIAVSPHAYKSPGQTTNIGLTSQNSLLNDAYMNDNFLQPAIEGQHRRCPFPSSRPSAKVRLSIPLI